MKTLNLVLIMFLAIDSLAFASADPYNNFGCGPWGMMGGYGAGGFGYIFSWLFAILVFIALILLVAWLVKQLKNGPTKKH